MDPCCDNVYVKNPCCDNGIFSSSNIWIIIGAIIVIWLIFSQDNQGNSCCC